MIEVRGRDAAREAYKVTLRGPGGPVTGYIPDRVISDRIRLTGGFGHKTAYEWISSHSKDIEDNLMALRDGRAATPPFDRMELEED